MYLRNLIRGTRLLHLGAAVLLSIGVTAATAAPVDKTGAGPAAISQSAKPAEKFNGQPIYLAALDALQKSHRELRDPAVRAKFIATWQNKHDTDGMLDTEAGTDRAIFEMVWSLGQRFDYYNPPVAAKAEADRINATIGGAGMPVGMKGYTKAIKVLVDRKKAGEDIKEAAFEALSKIAVDRPLWVPEEPFEGTPAQKAGVKKGDIILAIDGVTTVGMTSDQAVDKIRGKIGTTVKLTVKHIGEFADQTVVLPITRAQVQVRVVKSEAVGGGVVRIKMDHFSSQFGDQEMAQELSKAVKGNAQGIILDLRGNPGGFMEQVLAIGQMFMKEGIITQQVSREGDLLLTRTYKVSEQNFIVRDELSDGRVREKAYDREYPLIVPESMPVMVLINEGSASASEILAGALQANGRALILGQPTHGKGVGQNLVRFDNGKRNLHVTNFEFLPGGKPMDWVGIVPDVEVKMPEFAAPQEFPEDDTQLAQAKLEMLNVLAGNPVPHRDDKEMANRRDELRKAHQDDFAKEVEYRNKVLASPVDPKKPADEE